MGRKRGHDATGRARGEARHVRLYYWLLECPAWRDLNPVEQALYLLLCQRYNGANNGRLGLSVRDAGEALHVGKNTAARAFQGLQVHGFVVMVRKGHFDRKQRHASEWKLTAFDCDVTGEPASKAFMRWGREGKHGPSHGTDGPSGGTIIAKATAQTPRKQPPGPSHGTVRARSTPSTVPPQGHI
jgi:hypothetical protein